MLTNIAETKAKPSRKAHRVLPGFRLTLGFTLVYLSLIVLIPLSTIVLQSFQMSGSDFLALITDKRIISAFKISLLTSLSAALFNVALGVLTAWVLVRYSFPGKTFINGLIDLPFALPTAVAGISLTAIYSQNGWIGQIFYAVGIPSAYSAVGITIALVFIGLPFIVRTVQPVLEEWDTETEEAAAILGACWSHNRPSSDKRISSRTPAVDWNHAGLHRADAHSAACRRVLSSAKKRSRSSSTCMDGPGCMGCHTPYISYSTRRCPLKCNLRPIRRLVHYQILVPRQRAAKFLDRYPLLRITCHSRLYLYSIVWSTRLVRPVTGCSRMANHFLLARHYPWHLVRYISLCRKGADSADAGPRHSRRRGSHYIRRNRLEAVHAHYAP